MAISNSIEALVRSSGVIFTGTVIHTHRSTLTTLQPDEHLAVVRVDLVLRAPRELPDTVTLRMNDAHPLETGDRAVIFAHLWILGDGIAVREEAHLPTEDEEAVAAEIALLPNKLLSERLATAALVVLGEVARIAPAERQPFDRRSGEWGVAELNVSAVLVGEPYEMVLVHFPTPRNRLWARAPHFRAGLRGIFLLHHPSGPVLDHQLLVALDPLDVQPEQRFYAVRDLLRRPA